MMKPDENLITKHIESRNLMSFKFKNGQIKKGIINGCYGLCLHINFGVADKKVVTFDSIESMTESDVAMVDK